MHQHRETIYYIVIRLTHYDETNKRAHDLHIVRAKTTQFGLPLAKAEIVIVSQA